METEDFKNRINNEDKFCKYNNIHVAEAEPGRAVAVLDITENSLNGLGVVQGGAIFTLADLAFAAASNSYGQSVVALESNISFIRPGSGKYLRAEAREVNRGRSTCVYTIDVTNEEGKIVAHGTTTGFCVRQ